MPAFAGTTDQRPLRQGSPSLSGTVDFRLGNRSLPLKKGGQEGFSNGSFRQIPLDPPFSMGEVDADSAGVRLSTLPERERVPYENRSSPKRVGDNASGTFEPLRFPQTRRLKPRQRGAPRPPAQPPRPPPQAGYCHAGRDGGAAAGRLGRHSLPRVHSLGCKLRRAAVGPETTPRFHLH